MDLKYFMKHYHELLAYLREQEYSNAYIAHFQTEINWILSHADGNCWNSYQDIFLIGLPVYHQNRSSAKRGGSSVHWNCSISTMPFQMDIGKMPFFQEAPTICFYRSIRS